MIKNMIKKIKNLGGNTLYYPGCLTKFAAKDIEKKYKNILNKLGVDFIVAPEFVCCGSPVLNAGYKKDFENLKNENQKIFEKYNVIKIITNCPSCYKMFKDVYQTENIEVEHITKTLLKKAKNIKKKLKNDKITYHDPCHLGRHSSIYEDPRKLLREVGFEIIEMKKSGDSSMCCGGGGGVKTNFPELANKIAKKRLEQATAEILVTPCPLCYKHLKENSDKIEVYELSEVIE